MKLLSRLAVSILCSLPLSGFASSEQDRALEIAARSSYNLHVLLSDRITVEMNDGVGTVSGMVTDADLRVIANDTVGSIPGVKLVKNLIRIDESHAGISDDSIAVKVRTALHIQAGVILDNVQISVKRSIVRLRGEVASGEERRRLSDVVNAVSWVRGVQNDLVVQANDAVSPPAPEIIDDASITAQVRFALRTHRSTSNLRPHVTTNAGVVRLSGALASADERKHATEIASTVRGVKSVENSFQAN